ncbi:PRC-barrel domain-containing protein [Roseovarius aestuariivivens]|uniref:PRC-barrel domain-containing protein n=1 Tax=Roseovarius aestuariivivens TaxID=1888910 RepID=UPI001080C7AB|nr:PRC-barrel domain-containing protein [Roseovarius aestuariivivens]
MKLINTTALAAILAAGTAVADNHSSGDMKNSSKMKNKDDAKAESSENGVTAASVSGNKDTNGMNKASEELIRTRDITGGAIYTMNEASDEGWDETMMYEEVGSDWNEIGEIEDIVLSRNGKMTGVVAEVGGFLDIADKHVMLPIEDVKLVPVDQAGYVIVTKYNEEDLEDLDEVHEAGWY